MASKGLRAIFYLSYVSKTNTSYKSLQTTKILNVHTVYCVLYLRISINSTHIALSPLGEIWTGRAADLGFLKYNLSL